MNQKRMVERTNLSIRLKELSDRRNQMNSNIGVMTEKIEKFRTYVKDEMIRENERMAIA